MSIHELVLFYWGKRDHIVTKDREKGLSRTSLNLILPLIYCHIVPTVKIGESSISD